MQFQESPGFWRRIDVHPSPGLVSGGLEDDYHRFTLRLTHADGIVTGLEAQAERYPWSTCPGATIFLADQMVGQSLEAVAALDPHEHCTHLFDLLLVCAGHAGDAGPIRFDIWAGDRAEGPRPVAIFENGIETLRWQFEGTTIVAPDTWAGRDLRLLSAWRETLDPRSAERAMLLRRVAHLSRGRAFPARTDRQVSDQGTSRVGACYTYQMPRMLDAQQTSDTRIDFSRSGTPPLDGFEIADRGMP